jgi:GTP-binding protein HflX
MKLHETRHVERAVLAQVVHSRMDPDEAADSLLELGRLADTAGLEVAGQLTQNRDRPDGGTFFGAGKVEDLKALVAEKAANTVIFDNPLNAIQSYNLAKALGARIMDRSEIILEIFSRRARSTEAQTQVELAKLEFQLSRIPVTQAQQRFKGGIGMKGPGESHLQLRNEPLRRRIAELKKKLADIQSRQTTRGKAKREWPVVSLVGYTNAGKSTLLNTLTDADAYVDDRLFATLDTKTRKVWLSEKRQILLTDTVGFIRNLPHGLVASFKSTLDVAVQADLLLVLVDAAYPRVDDHIAVCTRTLEEIGAKDVPRLLILNKCDRGSADLAVLHVAEKYPQAIPVSAKTGYGLDLLKRAMIEELQKCCTLWQLPSAISPT